MARRGIAWGIAAALSLTWAPPAGSHEPAVHDFINMGADLYIVSESVARANVAIERCCHHDAPASVQYATAPGAAEAGSDYETTSGTMQFDEPQEQESIGVPLVADALEEGVESFTFSLSSTTGGAALAPPRQAEVAIVDDDGPSRVSFHSATYSRFENTLFAEVFVVRSGLATQSASASYTTSDQSATAGEDYTATSGTVTFAAEVRRDSFEIQLLDDEAVEGRESIGLALSDPTGAALAVPETATLFLEDDDTASSDLEPPITAFHQPLHGSTYRPGEARDILVAAADEGSGVARVSVALRRKNSDGSCAWWTGRRFRRRACGSKLWWKTKPGAEVVFFRLAEPLKPSRGTNVRNYLAFSRGRDAVGNVESSFETRRNRNRFEVRE
jgi:hypothetical protein